MHCPLRSPGWVTALFLFGTVPAHAASPNPIPYSRLQQLRQDNLHTAETVNNLTDMLGATQGRELIGLLTIINFGNVAVANVEESLTLGGVYTAMTSADDKAKVGLVAQVALDGAKRQLDTATAGINQYLTYLTSPAAVAEAQRLRDRLQEMREELDRYHY